MEHAEIIRILIVDDQMLIRQGLNFILSTQPDMKVVGEAIDGVTAVQQAQQTEPHVILMDVRMPGQTGIAATRTIMQNQPQIKIILLTTFDVEEYVFDGIRAGAVGYLLKDADTADLFDAVRAAWRGEAIYRTPGAGRALAQAILERPTPAVPEAGAEVTLIEPLTERELEILQHMAFGKHNREIASLCFVTEGTVKTHVHRILQKLGADDRTQAVVFAMRNGLVH